MYKISEQFLQNKRQAEGQSLMATTHCTPLTYRLFNWSTFIFIHTCQCKAFHSSRDFLQTILHFFYTFLKYNFDYLSTDMTHCIRYIAKIKHVFTAAQYHKLCISTEEVPITVSTSVFREWQWRIRWITLPLYTVYAWQQKKTTTLTSNNSASKLQDIWHEPHSTCRMNSKEHQWIFKDFS